MRDTYRTKAQNAGMSTRSTSVQGHEGPDGGHAAASAPEPLTELIGQAQAGRAGGWDAVYARLYAELHDLARLQLRQRWRGADRSPTSLVSRAWLRIHLSDVAVHNREHLIALLARAMRYALVDEVRSVLAQKRGEGAASLALEDHEDVLDETVELERLLAIDQALNELASVDPRMARLVELRYFGGMTDEEVADALGITARTVRRDWRRARALLAATLGASDPVPPPAAPTGAA